MKSISLSLLFILLFSSLTCNAVEYEVEVAFTHDRKNTNGELIELKGYNVYGDEKLIAEIKDTSASLKVESIPKYITVKAISIDGTESGPSDPVELKYIPIIPSIPKDVKATYKIIITIQ